MGSTFHPALCRMALQVYDDAVDELGDDQEAAWLASVAFMAALERVPPHRDEGRACDQVT